MIYAMSDIHGRYDLFLDMVDKIQLDDEDTLYILGDFVDRGKMGFKLLLDVANRPNVVPIMGNHDYTAGYMLRRLNAGIPEHEMRELEPSLNLWLYRNGGMDSYEEFIKLPMEKRMAALDYIDSFLPYVELELHGQKYVLCHAGIYDYEEGRPLSEYYITDFLQLRPDYTVPFFKDRILVSGHTPTAIIDPDCRGRIYKSPGHIVLDCGAVFDLGLGCICLDNMREYYVK